MHSPRGRLACGGDRRQLGGRMSLVVISRELAPTPRRSLCEAQQQQTMPVQSKLIHQANGQRTLAIVLETGDEVMSSLAGFADASNLSAAQFSAIGAFSDAVLGYFDWDQKKYLKTRIHEQVEVASFTGDVALN